MNAPRNVLLSLIAGIAGLCAPVHATVQIASMTPSLTSPQPIGTSIKWTVAAADSNPGPLAFQFNVTPPGGAAALVKAFNVGTFSAGAWISQPFVWMPTGIEGVYQIQVLAKDFTSGEITAKTVQFQVNRLVSGGMPVVVPTANALVALFSAPSCPAGSSMRVYFQQQSKSTPATVTDWMKCHPPASMTFEIAGMYPSTTYTMHSQTLTGSTQTNGPVLNFTTGALPTNISFPTFHMRVPPGSQTDTTDSIILHNLIQLGLGTNYPDVATDLSGNIIWYYLNNSGNFDLLTRPLQNGTMLTIEAGPAWNPGTYEQQLLRQIDLAGNILHETNTGIVQQQLLALGAADGGPCNTLPSPAPIGSACLGSFHHDAISFSTGGSQYIAVIADIEKIFPPGTQGDTSGLPVDIIGDMIIVLNSNWQAVWYFDTFQHDGGAPQLDINRPAVLGETCIIGQAGCPPMLLLGPGIATQAKDWLHANSLYYWPTDKFGGASGDIVWSSRHQDWVMKIDYNNGSGTGNILWRMGPGGDFAINNVFADSWPWFSHQHDVGIENNGTGVMTMFDNGNTRTSPPPVGLGSGDSRGMAITISETTMQVTPVLSADLGVFSTALGSAQLLSNGSYFFLPGIVVVSIIPSIITADSIEILPTAGTDTGTQVLNMVGPEGYRAWQMPSLYDPPTT